MLVLLTYSRTDADELEQIVEQIFEVMHDLYIKWKAGVFLLIDVPPMHRSPGGDHVVISRILLLNHLFSIKAKRLVSMASVTRRGIPSSFGKREISLQIPPKLRYLSSHLTPSFQISLMTLNPMDYSTV